MEKNHPNQSLRMFCLVLSTLLTLQANAAMNANSGITYTGRIMKADGVTPVISSGVTFSLALYDVNRQCLLYTENRTLDLSTSGGTFSFDLGDGAAGATQTYKGSLANVYDLFDNSKTFTGMTCGVAPLTTFKAATENEPRLLMVSFDAGDGNGPQNLPALKINPSPSALQAYRLNGYGTGDLLRIDSGVNKTTNANTDLTQTQYDEFWRLVKNPNTAYLRSSTVGALAGDVTGTIGANTVTKIQGTAVSATAPTAGQVLTLVGTTWTPTTPAASGVASITASLPLSVTGTATSAISIRPANTTDSGYLTAADWNIFSGKMGTGLTSGNFWLGNSGGNATQVTMTGDASMANTGVVTLATTGVVAGTYTKVEVDAKGRVTSGTSLSASDITSALGYTPTSGTTGFLQSGNSFGAGAVLGTNDDNSLTLETNNAARIYIGNTGDIGIGTNAPGAKLEVAGQIKITGGTPGLGKVLTSDATGLATWAMPSASGLSTSLASSNFYVGNSGGVATAVTMSGDASMSSTGSVTVDKSTTGAVNKIVQLDGSGVATVKGLSVNSGTGSVGLQSASTTTNYSLTFPAAAPSVAGQVMTFSTLGIASWTSPMTTSLTSANFWVGNSGNTATAVTMSGDATMDNAGAVTLATSGVVAGSYSKVLVDAKGRVTAGQSMIASDITGALAYTPLNKAGDTMSGNLAMGANDITNTGNITMAANKYFGLSSNTTPSTVAGQMWYDGGAIKYYDGTTTKSLGVAGAGITNINGLSANTQSFVIGNAGTDANISSVTATHTLNFPTASATNRGLLSSSDWSTFNNKMSTALGSTMIWVGNAGGGAVAVNVTGDASIANSGAVSLSTTGVTAGTYSKVVVDAKGRVSSGSAFSTADLPSLTDANIWVGNSGNAATAVTMTGDASMANTGVVTLATTGVTAGTFTKLGVDAKGRVTSGGALASSDVTTALGYTPLNKAGDTMTGNLAMGANDITNTGSITMAGSKYFGLSANTTAGTVAGQMWYDAGVIKYFDGSTTKSLGVAGAGITTLNGLTASSQTFVTATTGSDFTISSTGSTHTFAFPNASSTNRGALTAADWTTFNSKMGTGLASTFVWVGNSGGVATAVALSGDATVSNTGSVTVDKSTTGANNKIVQLNGSGVATVKGLNVNTATGSVSIQSAATTTNYSITLPPATPTVAGQVLSVATDGTGTWTSAMTTSLNSANFWVGNSGNAATAVTMTGDASMANTGVVTLATTGVAAGTYTKVGVDTKGRVTSGGALASADVTTALGFTPVNKAGDTMTGALNLGGFDISNTGNITMAGSKYFGLSANTTAGTVAGQMWYDAGVIKYYDGSTTKSLGVAGAGITSINGLSAVAQTFAVGTSGTDFNIASGTATHTLNIPTASATNRGALSTTDWTTFNNKMSNALASAKIWVGNSGGGAQAFDMTGDASISNAGVVTLATTAVSAGTYTRVQVDGKGRVIAGFAATTADMPALGDAKIWIGNSGSVPTALSLSGDATVANSGVVTVDKTSSGTASKILALDGSGVANVKGVSISTGTGSIALNSAGTTTNYSLTFPAAAPASNGQVLSATTAGILSWSTPVTGITSLNGLNAGTQTFAVGTSGTDFNISSTTSTHTLNIPTASAANRGALSTADWTTFNGKMGNALASGKIWVGNSGGGAQAFDMTGDASISNAGVVSLATSGVVAGSYSKVAVDAKGRVTAGQSMTPSDITTALGYTPANGTTGIVNGGNSFTAAITIGSNDAYAVNLESGGTVRMTFDTSGNIDLGTASVLRAPAGLVGAPVFTTTGAPTTGMWFPSTTKIGFSIGGTKTVEVNSEGLNIPGGAAISDGGGCTNVGTIGRDPSTGDLFICK